MLKICRDKWSKNENKLREKLKKIDLNKCGYKKLVQLTIDNILNDIPDSEKKWNIKKIKVIDDGEYQGTLLFVIPMETYQPSSYEYLITCVEYGSCSGCDTLQAIQEWKTKKDEKGNYLYTKRQLDDFMSLCRDILFNIKRPYFDKFIVDDEQDDWSEIKND